MRSEGWNGRQARRHQSRTRAGQLTSDVRRARGGLGIRAGVGVHRYVADGGQIAASGGLLAVHPAGDGRRVLRLPQPRRLVDALTNTDLGVTAELECDSRCGATRVWHMDRVEGGSLNR